MPEVKASSHLSIPCGSMVTSFLVFFAIRTSTTSFCLQAVAVAVAALLLTMEEINKINNLIII
jgi:hypothetical protein